jgi:hypothetical protein
MITEELLHYLWQYGLFNTADLHTTDHQPLRIVRPGMHNRHAGPDFFNAQLQINTIMWAGNVEIHIRSSDWLQHRHQEDPAYDKVILHVVWEHDRIILRENGDEIPTLELKGRVKKPLLERYTDLAGSLAHIPCEPHLPQVEAIHIRKAKDAALIERLQRKSDRLKQVLHLNQMDWEATLYQTLARYFGFKTNAVPFELLATSTPYALIRKYEGQEKSMHALLFGQAGLLKHAYKHPYLQELKKEYQYLSKKHELQSIRPELWKFMRMRPANFPSIRIAQFAAIYGGQTQLFRNMVERVDLDNYRKILTHPLPEFWKNHYTLKEPAGMSKEKNIGKSAVDLLLINVIVPLLFTYAELQANEKLKEKAITLLEALPAEKNSISRRWEKLGVQVGNAFDSQALIQLKTEHCDEKKCLLCPVGNAVLKQTV